MNVIESVVVRVGGGVTVTVTLVDTDSVERVLVRYGRVAVRGTVGVGGGGAGVGGTGVGGTGVGGTGVAWPIASATKTDTSNSKVKLGSTDKRWRIVEYVCSQ